VEEVAKAERRRFTAEYKQPQPAIVGKLPGEGRRARIVVSIASYFGVASIASNAMTEADHRTARRSASGSRLKISAAGT
jgi:hypothetical protein